VNEDELRAAFARHEAEAPDVEELHMTINKEAARRRKRRSTMLVGGVAAGVALAIGLPMYLTGQAAPAGKTPTAAASPSAANTKDLNLLLLGSDHRDSWEKGMARSDTIMIVHVPADRKKIYLISVERDLQVEIPGHGKGNVNWAFYYGLQKTGTAEGGLDLAEKTLTQLSGVTFDGGAVVEFGALRSITDTLGGVRVCLPEGVPLYLDYNAKPRKVLPAGCQVLNGTDAQALVQQRMGLRNGGYDRDRNAQRYMIGVAEKVTNLKLSDAATVLRLTRTSGLTIQLDGITVPELALQLHEIQPEQIVALSLSNTFHGDGPGETIPPQGMALLGALKERNLEKFVQEHPEMVLQR
jgi:LCP family protein required for cell wall assembly